jgi:predicted ATPase/DNA-binding winged helix-turn-helix (wHTH) protein
MSSNARASRNGVSFRPFRIFPAERLLERDGVAVPVGSRAFNLLAALVEKAGDVAGKEELISRAWPDLTVDESSLRFHIAGLRKALGDGRSGARYIANVPGRGYCLVAPTTLILSQPDTSAASVDSARPAHGLPHRRVRMVGRDETVGRINDLLARKRFLTIHGPSGIGKTTVAVAVAHAQVDAFDGAVHFLDLGPLADPALVGGALASALGVMPQAVDPVPAIIDFLRGRRALILLDSCEHVVGAAAALAEQIYHEAPGVALLVTSRERLRVEGEHVVELSPLARPPDEGRLSISQVLSFAAPHLFADRAAAGGYDVELTDADAAIVTQICRKLDGIALAIELVASRVAAHGLEETAALLDSRLRLLWRGRRTALPRHQTLNAALDWSYDLIGDVERTVLRRLSIFVGLFGLSAAQRVAANGDLDEVQVVEALEGLVSKSLVSVRQDAATSSYRLLDTTRAYANVKLAESGELDRVARRHAIHVRDALRDVASQTGVTDGPRAGPADATGLLGDVFAALRWSFAARGEAALAASVAAAAAGLFLRLSLLNECRRWTEAALSTLDAALRDTETELQLQAALGHALMFTDGNGDQTREALARALEIAGWLGDRPISSGF